MTSAGLSRKRGCDWTVNTQRSLLHTHATHTHKHTQTWERDRERERHTLRQPPHTSRGFHILFIPGAGTHLLLVSEGERSTLGQVGLFRNGTRLGLFSASAEVLKVT